MGTGQINPAPGKRTLPVGIRSIKPHLSLTTRHEGLIVQYAHRKGITRSEMLRRMIDFFDDHQAQAGRPESTPSDKASSVA